MNKSKEPTLLRQIITIHHEQALRRKAMRLLSKQSWSVDFLAVLLAKAAKLSSDNIKLEITNKDGMTVTLTYQQAKQSDMLQLDDSIFNHLDDNAAIDRFVREHSTRG